MRSCIFCGKLTEGSVGVAGIHWKNLCQPCKDGEDNLLALRIKAQAKAFDILLEAVNKKEGDKDGKR